MKKTVTPESTGTKVPTDQWGLCGWCGLDPNGPDCCRGQHPDRYALDADVARAPQITLGQPQLVMGQADYVRRYHRPTIGGVR